MLLPYRENSKVADMGPDSDRGPADMGESRATKIKKIKHQGVAWHIIYRRS